MLDQNYRISEYFEGVLPSVVVTETRMNKDLIKPSASASL